LTRGALPLAHRSSGESTLAQAAVADEFIESLSDPAKQAAYGTFTSSAESMREER
jgi:hypothetical protein